MADTEVPNNRSSVEERMFSPILRLLPPPAAWLLSLGLSGLFWFALLDRRWLILAAPIAVSWATMAFFWAEDRFRFHSMPILAFCSGLFIDAAVRNARQYRQWQLPTFGAVAILFGMTSVYLGDRFPPPAIRWDHIVWGYIKMGKLGEARTLAERVAIEQPDNGSIMEARGFLAASAQQYQDAVTIYTQAIALRPRSYVAHYNLAKALLLVGDRNRAAEEARTAMILSPSVESKTLLQQIEAAP